MFDDFLGEPAYEDPPVQGPHLRHPFVEGEARTGHCQDQDEEPGGGAEEEGGHAARAGPIVARTPGQKGPKKEEEEEKVQQ